MKIKPESNNRKILLALRNANKSLSVKILAEITKIPYSNIHRNLKQLFDNDFISKQVSQEGRNRFTYISLTQKGSDFKTYIEKVKPKKKPTHYQIKVDTTNLYDNEVESDTIRLGIGFYRDYARGLGIPNYSSVRIAILKFKIGLKLIEQSKLIDAKGVSIIGLKGAI